MINQMQPWIGEEEKQAVAEYLDSGGWLTEFKHTRKSEAKSMNNHCCDESMRIKTSTTA